MLCIPSHTSTSGKYHQNKKVANATFLFWCAQMSQIGNYNAIVTNREDFTQELINVLEEGADKLTLADMNEVSAEYLSLQTAQSLAINSLSLAAQSARSVLIPFAAQQIYAENQAESGTAMKEE